MKSRTTGITASILGASGYSGAMVLRILLRHPNVEVENVFASSGAGQNVHDLFPAFRGLTDKRYEEYSLEKVENSEIIFLALPAEHAMDIVPGLLNSGKRVIDLSGDFRLKDVDLYSQYYGATHRAIDLVADACYGLPEINRSSIASANLLSNPGCYPTSAIIPLGPLLKNDLIEAEDISISSLSGVTGAGRKASTDYSFAEVDGSVKAYRVGNHQHIPEIESVLSDHSAKSVKVSFVPHLLPIVSGIYSTIFVRPKGEFRPEAIEEVYRISYDKEPFVRYHGTEIPQLKGVLGSNFIDFGWKYDSHSGKLILLSAIDNLIKGAAGQAVQNMNIMCGFQEKEGLIV